MAERKYGLLSPSLQAQLHFQALLSRLPESGPLERVINNDPASYHAQSSSYLPTNSPVDLNVPPLMFGGGAKDSTLPTFKPNPQVLPPSLHQLATLLRAINAPTAECVTVNDYALVLSSQLRKHFDLSIPLSTSPQLTIGEQAAKRKLMLALDDDGGSLDLARELIKRLRNTIAVQQGRIDELMSVKLGLDAIMTDAKNIRAALEDVRQTVKYQYLDSQDLILKCGDAFKEMSGVDVFSSKAQLSLNASGKFANSQSGGLSVIAQEQLKMELERAGIVGGDPFKDRLSTCLYTLSTMRRYITVALQRTPLNPDEAPADAARFDWEHDESTEGKRFRRKFPSVQNLARKLGISSHAPKERPSEGLPSFMEPLANYNTPSQELALVKAMVAMARDIASAVQLISILADKAGESVNKSIRSDSNATSFKSSSHGGPRNDADLDEDEDDGRDDVTTGSALRIVSLEGDLRVSNEKLAAAEARLATLEAAADGDTKSPRANIKKSQHNTSPSKGAAAKAVGKVPTKALPPSATTKKQKAVSPAPSQKATSAKGHSSVPNTPHLSKTELLLGRPGTPAPARQGSASRSASFPLSLTPPPVETNESGMQTGEVVYGMAEMEAMHQTNQQLAVALTSKTERVVELEDELNILRGRMKVLDRFSSSIGSSDYVHGNDEYKKRMSSTSDHQHSEGDPGSTDVSSSSGELDRELSTTVSVFASPRGVVVATGADSPAYLTHCHSDNTLQSGKANTTSSTTHGMPHQKKRGGRKSKPPHTGSLDGKQQFMSTSQAEDDDMRQSRHRSSSSVKDQIAAAQGAETDVLNGRKQRKSKTHAARRSDENRGERITPAVLDDSDEVERPTRRKSSNTGSKGNSRRTSGEGKTDSQDRRRSSSLKGEISKSHINMGGIDSTIPDPANTPLINMRRADTPLSLTNSPSTPEISVPTAVAHHSQRSPLRQSDPDVDGGVFRPSALTEQFALNTIVSREKAVSGDSLPRWDTAPSLRDDLLGDVDIGSLSSQLNNASVNHPMPLIETTSALPTSLPTSTNNYTSKPQSLTLSHIAEVRHRALAGKKGLGSTPVGTAASRGTTSVVEKLRNALSSPLPPVSDEESRTLAAMRGPPTSKTTSPPPRFANVHVTEQILPYGDAARAAVVEQIRLQLMSMSAASPQRHGTSLTRGDAPALSNTTSRQIIFAPAFPMPAHDNPDGLRRL